MKTRTLQQTVTFKASPRQVHDMSDGFEGASVVVGSARGNQPEGWRKIHGLGFGHLGIQSGAYVQAWRATGWWPDLNHHL
jgi:hypothetical protein